MLYYSKLEMVGEDKHSCLMYPFVSYEESEALCMRLQGLHLQHFIFSITYKHSSLLCPFLSYDENKV
jgi:hypothetical protein